MNPGEVHVWTARLDRVRAELLPQPTASEMARAERLRTDDLRRRYLRSHAALRAILRLYTNVHLSFAVTPHGKPYLPRAPELRFNLSHSDEMAVIGVALDVEVGVDVERLRPMADYRAIADRFFPPSEAAALGGELDFFRRWTRIEAMLKARGVGLYGSGIEIAGEWTVSELRPGDEFAAAVAAMRGEMTVVEHDFGAEHQ